jgi:parvulin-like peptidyl-prolyl isomerase
MSDKVRCLHLLIKHQGSRNPISRRTNQSTAGVPKEAAIAELQQWQARIASGDITFEAAASQRSDCGSYANGGDLDFFSRGMMQKPFEDASFALKVGEVSGIVDTDSGVHLIKRIA